jgi:hypothetical protein
MCSEVLYSLFLEKEYEVEGENRRTEFIDCIFTCHGYGSRRKEGEIND